MFIAAYDFGTTGCKASFYSEDGVLAATAYHEYPTYFPKEGWVEQDPADWKTALVKSTGELLQKSKILANDIACISFSGHMMGCTPVDKQGSPISNRVMLWADNRADLQANRLIEIIGWERFYSETGGGLDVVLYPAAKIPWLKENEPELYRQADKFIGTKDVICAWLTGNIATDFSEASNIGLLHLANRCWYQDFLKSLGISPEKMPQLLPSTAIVGKLSQQAANKIGLLEGTPVVLGGGDVSCGTAGAGAVRENIPYMCIGSAGWISVAVKDPIINLSARPMSICHVVPDLYTSQIIMFSAGVAYKWIRDEIFFSYSSEDKDGPGSEVESFERLDQLAGTSPAGSNGVIFLPYMRAGGAPHYDLSAKGALIGLNLTTRKADLIRAVLEGVALNLRIMLRCLEEKCSFNNIRIIGGGAKSSLWRQIFADVFRKEVLTLSAQQEANTLGAALVGGVGIGLFKDFSAIERFIQVKEITSCNPDEANVYDELLPVFMEAYKGLRNTNEALSCPRAG